MTKIEVALFDMAATTVKDVIRRPDLKEPTPLVLASYKDAFAVGKVSMPYEELNDCRGRDKREVFREKVAKYRIDLSEKEQLDLADELHDKHFVPSLLNNFEYIDEMPSTSETFRYLKDHGVYIGTGTGFPPIVANAINKKLGWLKRRLVDLAISGGAVGGGRPKPNMINYTLIKAGYLPEKTNLSNPVEGFDYSILLKAGDTAKDQEEGLNVGATTVGVLTGTQSREKLEAVFARYGKEPNIISSIGELPGYLESKNWI